MRQNLWFSNLKTAVKFYKTPIFEGDGVLLNSKFEAEKVELFTLKAV